MSAATDFDPDFDHVFRVLPDGTTEDVAGVWAPDVFHSETDDVEISGRGTWQPLTGYTGQHGYRGACLHPSEYFGGGLRRDVLSEPGVYVLTVVRDLDTEEGEDDAIGWCVLRLTEF